MSIPDLRHNEGATGIDLSLAVEGTKLKSVDFSPPGRLEQASGLSVDISGQKITGTIPSGTADQVYTVQLVYDDDSEDIFTWTIDQPTLAHSGKHLKILVPAYNDPGDGETAEHSYLRMGMPDQDDETGLKTKSGDQSVDVRGPGWYEFTSGHRTIETGSDYYKVVHGEASDFFYRDQFDFSSHDTYSIYHGSKFDYAKGTAYDVFFGGRFSSTVGFDVETSLAAKFEYACGLSYSATITKDRTLSRDIEHEAADSVHLKVDPSDGPLERVFESVMPVLAAGVSAHLAHAGRSQTKDAAKDSKKVSAVSHGVGVGMGLLDVALTNIPKKDEPATELIMNREKIRLECRGYTAPKWKSYLEEKGSKLKAMAGSAGNAAATWMRSHTNARILKRYDKAKAYIKKKMTATEAQSWIEVHPDIVALRCGKAKFYLHSSGVIEMSNDDSRVTLSEDGIMDVRNKGGGLMVGKNSLLLGHKGRTILGVNTKEDLEKSVAPDLSKQILFSKSSAEFKHDKAKLGGTNIAWQ